MRLLYGLVVLAMLLAQSNGARHHLRYFGDSGDDDADDTRELLRSILQQRFVNTLRSDGDEKSDNGDRFYSSKRADTATKKCNSVKSGQYYDGDSKRSIDNIATSQDCMSQCERDGNCYGWAYQGNSKSCILQNSIGWPINDPTYVGGSCIGLAAKEKVCKEKLPNTIYNGVNGQYFSVATVEACMKKCDITPICLGYMFNGAHSACITQTAQYGSGTVSDWTGGSCVIPKPAYPPISIEEYRQQALAQHNLYRRKHCTPELKLNATLNDIAQKYAESLAAAKKFEHSKNRLNGQWMGENLFMSGGDKPLYTKGSIPVTAWYNEIKDYDWSHPDYSDRTGHFTQLLWKDSTQLGMGRAVTNDGTGLYIVANYFPGGNMGGAYADNVKRPLC